MNYKRHYDLLIERARNRVLDCYVERHHIIPRCMGGSDEKENIVALTPEEHYVAHQLLVKIYPNVKGLIYAVIAMTGLGRGVPRRNKLYAWVRKRQSQEMRGKPSPWKGKRFTPEQLRKISDGRRGKKHTEEWKRAHTERMRGNTINTGRKWDAEVVKSRAKSNSIAQKGKKLSAQHKDALSIAWKDKDKKAARSNAIKAACSSEESKARRRAAWADPEKSAKRLQSLRESAKDPMVQARKSVTLATTWAIKKGRPFSLIPQAS